MAAAVTALGSAVSVSFPLQPFRTISPTKRRLARRRIILNCFALPFILSPFKERMKMSGFRVHVLDKTHGPASKLLYVRQLLLPQSSRFILYTFFSRKENKYSSFVSGISSLAFRRSLQRCTELTPFGYAQGQAPSLSNGAH